MVAPFLNDDEMLESETEIITCPTTLLDLSLKELLTQWSDTMLKLINEIPYIFNNDQLRWQDKYYTINGNINKNNTIFYLGLTLIVVSLLLFYFELII